MTDSQHIELLSTLPVKDIDDLRLMVSYYSYAYKGRDVQRWADLLNRAAEWKQAQALRGLDDTETYTFI